VSKPVVDGETELLGNTVTMALNLNGISLLIGCSSPTRCQQARRVSAEHPDRKTCCASKKAEELAAILTAPSSLQKEEKTHLYYTRISPACWTCGLRLASDFPTISHRLGLHTAGYPFPSGGGHNDGLQTQNCGHTPCLDFEQSLRNPVSNHWPIFSKVQPSCSPGIRCTSYPPARSFDLLASQRYTFSCR